jgi:periplasmic divalent cation tolerance protein
MYSMIYVTTSSILESKKIARKLIEEKIAACVNIVPTIDSIYLWKGEIEEDSESIMFIKTRNEFVETLIKRIEEIHSYEIPCILEFKVDNGSENYFRWIDSEIGLI